jgi:hypothetical protein
VVHHAWILKECEARRKSCLEKRKLEQGKAAGGRIEVKSLFFM